MESTDRIINIGQYDSSQNSRVVSSEGISYAVTNGHKDGMPKIIQEAINTDAEGNARTIVAQYGARGYSCLLRSGDGFGITGVMEIVQKEYVMEPNVLRQERTDECKKLRKMNGDKGMKFNGGNKMFVPRTDGMANTLTSSVKDNMLAVPELRMEDGCLVDKEGKRYRIRKLTPRECFRLQDVSESDIDKMLNAKIAKTNLYKLAGNSICISPMYHIFRKLFIQKECESQQLELF